MWTTCASPFGEVLVTACGGAVTSVLFAPSAVPAVPPTPSEPVLEQAVRELDQYFAGTRTSFEVPVAPVGTPFQRAVWGALREVPPGTQVTYGELARRLGAPAAVRAVGAANARNPVAVLVPCHRVVGADGVLRGDAARKRALLALEGLS